MKKPRKHKPKQCRAPQRAAPRAAAPKASQRQRGAFDWDGLLARTATPVRNGKPARAQVIALGYSRDERSALGLLLLPFVLLAFAMGLTQTMKALHLPDAPSVATVPQPDVISQAERMARAIRATPRLEVAPTPATTAARPVDLPLAAAATHVEPPAAVMQPGDLPAAVAASRPAVPPVASVTESANPAATAPVASEIVASVNPASSALPIAHAPPAPASLAAADIAADPARVSDEPPEPASGEFKLAALGPLGSDASILARDGIEPGFRSRSICEAPANLPRAGRSLPPLIAPPAATGAAASAFGQRLAAAAEAQMTDLVVYTDRYKRIAYPMGDVPPLFGVCTDVVVRAYRSVGLDLQALVQQTRIGSGDTSIDHRRVETLRRFFAAYGASLKPTDFAEDYQPGDIVTYYRPQNRHSKTHIAIVSDKTGASGRPMIVHNRGWGPQIEDGLFVDQITGHYRFTGLPPATAVRIAGSAAGGEAAQARTPAIPARSGATAAAVPQLAVPRPARAPAACRPGEAARACPVKPAVPIGAQRRAGLTPPSEAR